MLTLRSCLVGIALIFLDFGLLWAVDFPPRAGIDPESYYHPAAVFVELVFVSLFGAGAFVIFRGLRLAPAKDAPGRSLPRIFPEIPLQNVIPWRGRSSFPSIVMTTLSAFSVSGICVLTILLIIFPMFGPLPQHGLLIFWKKPQPAVTDANPWARTMGVYIRHPSQVYLNGEPVMWDKFEARLREELSHRAEWTVYVEADADRHSWIRFMSPT